MLKNIFGRLASAGDRMGVRNPEDYVFTMTVAEAPELSSEIDRLLREIKELKTRIAELEEQQRWRDDMENAPHNCSVLLGWRDWRDGSWCMEVGAASTGRRVGDSSSVSWHGSATHWMRRPEPPEKPND